jgi:hypothetical protein
VPTARIQAHASYRAAESHRKPTALVSNPLRSLISMSPRRRTAAKRMAMSCDPRDEQAKAYGWFVNECNVRTDRVKA